MSRLPADAIQAVELPSDEVLLMSWMVRTLRSVTGSWELGAPGVLTLPSGRLVRGRGLRRSPRPGGPDPDFGLYLLGQPPPDLPWESRWIRWPDFRLPAEPDHLREALAAALDRTAGERVEVACAGGRGRTGTALACLAVLDGVPAAEAVSYIRAHYDPQAVETPGQRRFVARFGG